MTLSESPGGLPAKPYQEVHALEAKNRIDTGAILIDVREPDEWAAGHAQGARHIPLAQLGQRKRELPADRPIITVCRSGARSARAAAVLAEQGREVSNLRGGMRAWAAAGLPLVAEGGGPGAVI
jgi:rhodanese-related sulfurtransferase